MKYSGINGIPTNPVNLAEYLESRIPNGTAICKGNNVFVKRTDRPTVKIAALNSAPGYLSRKLAQVGAC